MAFNHSFKVRDFRNKGFFIVDDKYLNGYAKVLGTTTSMIYFALCRSADKEQIAFPSQKYIAEKLGIHERTVRRHLEKLKKWNLVKIEKIRNHEGKFLHNTYYLLDRSEWKKPRGHQRPVAIQRTPVSKTRGHQRPHKDTHIKDTHISLIGKRKSLKSITEGDMQYIAEYYQVPLSFVKSKYDDLINYCNSKGKRYKDYVSALRNFVKKDAIKIRKEQRDKSLII